MKQNDKEVIGVVVEHKKITKLILLGIVLVVFMLGYLSRARQKDTVSFTYEEIQMIENFQAQLEYDLGPKAQVVVYKDRHNTLMLGWE